MPISIRLGSSLPPPETAVIDRLDQEAIEHYWPQITELLDERPELWMDVYTKELMFENALSGALQVWMVVNEKTEIVQLVFFTRRYVAPSGEATFQIFWMSGTGLREFLPVLVSTVEHIAHDWNCSKVEITGRKGFEKLLAPYGVRHSYSVYEKTVVAPRRH